MGGLAVSKARQRTCERIEEGMSKKGTPKPQRNWTTAELKQLREMRTSGKTLSEIAYALDRTRTSVAHKALLENIRLIREEDI